MLDIDIEHINSPSVRTFQPDRDDKSGRIALMVANAPPGATYRWSTHSEAVKFIAANAPATSMLAGRPGVRTLSVEINDPKTGDSGTATTWIAYRNSWPFANIPARTPPIGKQECIQPGSTRCFANIVWTANATSSCNRRDGSVKPL